MFNTCYVIGRKICTSFFLFWRDEQLVRADLTKIKTFSRSGLIHIQYFLFKKV